MSGGRRDEVRRLWRARPRSALARWSGAVLVGVAVWSWTTGEIRPGELFGARRLANLERFLERDATPFPLRRSGEAGADFSWAGLVEWAGDVLSERGLEAVLATLWIALAAIALAAAGAAVLAPLGARTLVTGDPYARGGRDGGGGRWRVLVSGVRVACVLLRAIPEYVWAFLLLAVLGPGAWPAVLALALHNAGILGRLGAETIENLDAAPLRALRTAGATRRQLGALVAFPLALPRFLLYFFYRFETCIREATVLGMLGTVSLGYFIQEARGRQRYDEMLLFVALGAVLVLLADLLSFIARRLVR